MIIKSGWISLVFFFNTVSLTLGQAEHIVLPYYVDIKKDIRNVKSVTLSSIGKELSYIPLETSPECLIESIKKVILSETYIFISEFTRLLQFDREGRFVRQIGSAGRGPEEFVSVNDFCIDILKKEIYIISNTRLIIYSFNGTFISSIKLSFHPSQIICKDQNSLMFYLQNFPGKINPSWTITNRRGVIIKSIKNSLKRSAKPGMIIINSPLYLFNNSAHFMEFGIDTLYYFKGEIKEPYAVFSYGNLKMDFDQVINQSMIKSNINDLTGKLWIGSIIETNDYFFLTFFLGITNAAIHGVYNKKTQEVTFLKEDAFCNDLDGGVKFWPRQIVNDNNLLGYADAFSLMKKVIPTDLRRKLTESSNPVLIVLKIQN